MAQQPEMLYLAVLGLFLVLVRSPWPWTRGGAVVLLAGLAAAAFFGWRRDALDLALAPSTLPVTLLAVLVVAVAWWSLHSARRQETARQPGDAGTRARLAGAAAGVATVALLAVALGAPTPAVTSGVGSPPWFLAGLAALASLVGDGYAWGLVPAAAFLGLALAPNLDAHDSEASAPFDGRRDEVPFFFFAWLAVGVLPIVFAAFWPDFGAAPSPSLAERFWLGVLGAPLPEVWLLRELPGLLAYALIFLVLPWRLPAWRATKGVFSRHLRRLGRGRYALLMTLAGVLVLVPVKVAIHALFSIGPWLVLPGGIGL